MIRRHPSRRALREWLDGEIDPSVDAHVATCDRCSNDLEALAEVDTGSTLRDALRSALDPPEDLVPRVEAGVIARLDSRVVLGYFADAFGAGLETTRLFVTDDPTEETTP